MRICLDSSYLLPIFGIGLKNIPNDIIVKLLDEGHKLLISEISIFECIAKAAKLASSGELSLNRLIKGLLGVTYSQSLTRVNIFDGDLIRIAATARRFISDFIDCIVLATAAMQADILLTEDTLLLELPQNLQEYIHSINPKLQILGFREYTQKYKSLK